MISFRLGATYNTLASPVNMKRWGLKEDADCSRCGKGFCTVAHVLSGCAFSLQGGWYRDRHNAVLRGLAHAVKSEIDANKRQKKQKKSVLQPFVKEGADISSQKESRKAGLLEEAKDWEMLVDLKKQLVVPKHICDTKLRPDIVVFSNTLHTMVVIELTCQCEENTEARHMEKTSKYVDELVPKAEKMGWKVVVLAVEVGACGYVAWPLRACLRLLGLCNQKIGKIVKETSANVLRWSFWIWVKRDSREWWCSSIPSMESDRKC